MVDFGNRFEDRRFAYQYLRRAVEAQLRVNPLIIALVPGQPTHGDLMFTEQHAHPDGFTCFNTGTTRVAEPYRELVDGWLPQTLHHITRADGTTDRSMIYIPCGTLGMDARPWYGADWSGPYVLGVTPGLFERHLEDIKAFIDSGKVTTLRTVILYAWNEWGEAAKSIEPSRVGGYSYTDVIRQVFGLTPRTQRP